jgi:phosphatidylglycerophosphate synthase
MKEAYASSLFAPDRPWDARLARWLVAPLVPTTITPNHLTTVRLIVGLGGVAAFAVGSYGWSNVGALLLVLSNFLDHTDGELARMSGKTSHIGHLYDLVSDALVHVLLFAAIGMGLSAGPLGFWAVPMGTLAGCAVSLIFWLRMRIEERLGKAGTRQPALGGFEVEDVLYLMPLASLSDALQPLLIAAAVGAPLFALWVIAEYLRMPAAQPVPSSIP